MKALVGAFNREKALVGPFSVIIQPVVELMDRFAALVIIGFTNRHYPEQVWVRVPSSTDGEAGGQQRHQLHLYYDTAASPSKHSPRLLPLTLHLASQPSLQVTTISSVTYKYFRKHGTNIFTTTVQIFLELLLYCCLRSRPVTPNVVRQLVS